MQFISLNGIPAGGYAWRPRFGGNAFVVIAKATFDLTPGTASLAAVQDGLNETDNHWDDDTSCSVYAPSDMAPFKERADVTLVGDAFAPTPAGARTVVARLCTAGMDKKVAIFCDRHLDEQGRVQEGEPFTRMALRYERAAGGRLSDNPVGIEPATKTNRGDGVRRLPNVQAASSARKGRGAAAGFGPLGADWPLRRRLLRGAAKRFQDVRWRELPLPSALDCTYFNEAPRDQRVDAIRADERILLENLHPRFARLSSRLPGLTVRAFAEIDGEVVDVPLSADTLWIDMTRSVATVTWRGSLEIASLEQAGRIIVVLQQPGETLSSVDVMDMLRPRSMCPSSVRMAGHAGADSSPGSASDSDVNWVLQPVQAEEPMQQLQPRQRMHTLDLAAGAEELHRPVGAPLPFIEPSPTETLVVHPTPTVTSATAARLMAPTAPAPVVPAMAPSIAPPSAMASSPWAGSFSATQHTLRPPATVDRESVTPPPLMLVPAPTPPPSRPRADASVRGALPKSHRIEVLGCEAAELARVRTTWGLLEDELPGDKLNRDLRAAFGTVDDLAPPVAERHLCRIMTTSSACDTQGMREAMMDAVDEDGVFTPPLLLVHGVLRPTFDEVEVLRATIASVATYLKAHDALREEVTSAREILAQQAVAPEAASELTERIRDTFDDTIDCTKVDARIERMLLEGRSYQKKQLLKGSWIHATLTIDGESTPCYLAEPLAKTIPLYTELCVRLVAELHPRQDQNEKSTRALRVIALGRVVARQEEC